MFTAFHKNTLGATLAAAAFLTTPAFATTIYFNDFETPGTAYNGLAASGTLSGLSTTSLPTDSGGIGSANQSTWLGRVGAGVGKNTQLPEVVTLTLSGLVVGSVYSVAFDLLIGASWDGVANGYGPDEWGVTAASGANTTPLVNAVFSNCGLQNQLCGANGPQTYRDSTPLAGTAGTTFAPTTGADFSSDQNFDYSQDYAIYYFGHGTGNPSLSFMAGDSTATLTFQRTSGSTDSADEYWALDNILVTGESVSSGTPEPGTLLLLGAGLTALLLLPQSRNGRRNRAPSPSEGGRQSRAR
jgi:hypothetical protein